MFCRSRSQRHLRSECKGHRRVNTVSYKASLKALEASAGMLTNTGIVNPLGLQEKPILNSRPGSRIFPDVLYAEDIPSHQQQAQQQQADARDSELQTEPWSVPQLDRLKVDTYTSDHTILNRGKSVSLENIPAQAKNGAIFDESPHNRARKISKILSKFNKEASNPDAISAAVQPTKGLTRQRSVSQDVTKRRQAYLTERLIDVTGPYPRNTSEGHLHSYDVNKAADDRQLLKVSSTLSFPIPRSPFNSPKLAAKQHATDADKTELFNEMNDCVLRDDYKRLKVISKRKGVDVNLLNEEGTSLLHEAAYRGKLKCLHVLIKYGGVPNLLDREATTPLHAAIFGQELEAAKLLLENKAFPDCVDMAGCTPLHYAILIGHINLTALLLEHGANPLCGCEQGTAVTPFQLAINLKRNVILNVLIILPCLQVA